MRHTANKVNMFSSYKISKTHMLQLGNIGIPFMQCKWGELSQQSNCLWAGQRIQFQAKAGECLFITVSRLTLGPNQPPIQLAPRTSSSGAKQP